MKSGPFEFRPAVRRLETRRSSSAEPANGLEPAEPPRNFDCSNYDRCLSLAAALDWRSFTCDGCNFEINEQLIWRAQSKLREDPKLARMFKLPILNS